MSSLQDGTGSAEGGLRDASYTWKIRLYRLSPYHGQRIGEASHPGPPDQTECPICRDDLDATSLTWPACNHRVCLTCLGNLRLRAGLGHCPLSCPICRNPWPGPDGDRQLQTLIEQHGVMLDSPAEERPTEQSAFSFEPAEGAPQRPTDVQPLCCQRSTRELLPWECVQCHSHAADDVNNGRPDCCPSCGGHLEARPCVLYHFGRWYGPLAK